MLNYSAFDIHYLALIMELFYTLNINLREMKFN